MEPYYGYNLSFVTTAIRSFEDQCIVYLWSYRNSPLFGMVYTQCLVYNCSICDKLDFEKCT